MAILFDEALYSPHRQRWRGWPIRGFEGSREWDRVGQVNNTKAFFPHDFKESPCCVRNVFDVVYTLILVAFNQLPARWVAMCNVYCNVCISQELGIIKCSFTQCIIKN